MPVSFSRATNAGHAAGSSGNGTTLGAASPASRGVGARRRGAIDATFERWRASSRRDRGSRPQRGGSALRPASARSRRRGLVGLEREHAQQRHREAGRLVRRDREVGAALRADLVGELHGLGREARRIAGEPRPRRRTPSPPSGTTCATATRWNSDASSSSACDDDKPARGQRVALREQRRPVAGGQRIGDAIDVLAIDRRRASCARRLRALRRRRTRWPGRAATGRRAASRARRAR